MNKIYIFRILSVTLSLVGILLVVFLWFNQRNMLFVATVPILIASFCQSYYNKNK